MEQPETIPVNVTYQRAYDTTTEKLDALPEPAQWAFTIECLFVFWPAVLPMVIKDMVS